MTSTADVWPVPSCGPTELRRWPFGTMVAAMLRRPGGGWGNAKKLGNFMETSKYYGSLKNHVPLAMESIVVPDVCFLEVPDRGDFSVATVLCLNITCMH